MIARIIIFGLLFSTVTACSSHVEPEYEYRKSGKGIVSGQLVTIESREPWVPIHHTGLGIRYYTPTVENEEIIIETDNFAEVAKLFCNDIGDIELEGREEDYMSVSFLSSSIGYTAQNGKWVRSSGNSVKTITCWAPPPIRPPIMDREE